MSKYKSEPATISCAREVVYSKLSDVGTMRALVDKLPDEARAKMQGVEFGADTITFEVAPVGKMQIKLTEAVAPEKIVYSAVLSPVPFGFEILLSDGGDGTTQAVAALDIDIPLFLRPMVEGKLKEACAQFAKLFTVLPFESL